MPRQWPPDWNGSSRFWQSSRAKRCRYLFKPVGVAMLRYLSQRIVSNHSRGRSRNTGVAAMFNEKSRHQPTMRMGVAMTSLALVSLPLLRADSSDMTARKNNHVA